MRTFEIFKSEGGFRVCGAVWNDGPVMDQSPWFKTLEEAEKARDKMKADRLEKDALDCAFSWAPESLYPPDVRKRAQEIRNEVRGQL